MQKTCKHVNLCALSSHLFLVCFWLHVEGCLPWTPFIHKLYQDFAGFKQLASYKYANPTGNPRANVLKVVVMDITPNPPAIPTNAL